MRSAVKDKKRKIFKHYQNVFFIDQDSYKP